MKRSFKLENLDCAHCAAKMENEINKIPEVISASISFMSARLTLEAADVNFERVTEQAQKAISGIERDCKIVK